MAQPPGSDTRASPTRASSGPSTSTDARILRTMSYGASVLAIGPPSDMVRPSSDRFHRDAVLRQQQRHGGDVGKPRHVRQHQPLVGEQAGGHQRQGGVLGAADADLAGERPATADADAIRVRISSLGSATPRWRMYLPALSA